MPAHCIEMLSGENAILHTPEIGYTQTINTTRDRAMRLALINSGDHRTTLRPSRPEHALSKGEPGALGLVGGVLRPGTQ